MAYSETNEKTSSNNMSDSQKETTWTSDLGLATIILEINNRMKRKGSITI